MFDSICNSSDRTAWDKFASKQAKMTLTCFLSRRYATDFESKFMTRLINMRVVKNQTTNGKVAHFSALVVAGNEHGGLGFAQSKHSSGPDAIQKASKKATKEHRVLSSLAGSYHFP